MTNTNTTTQTAAALAAYRFVCFATSSNKKTANIPQTYTAKISCPDSCVLKNSGCYAGNGPTLWQWSKCEKESALDINGLIEWARSSTYTGQLLRHNIAGDIAVPGTDEINADLVEALGSAYRGRRAWTYTHCAKTEQNFAIARAADWTINFSCETLGEVDQVIDAGLPAVVAVTRFEAGMKTPKGRKVILCPEQRAVPEGEMPKTCATCGGICQARKRTAAIAFLVHGNGAKKAAAAIEKKMISIKAI